MARNRHVKCPICGDSFEWDNDLKLGDVVFCSDCDEELKIVNIDPPQLKRMVELLEVSNGSYKSFYEDDNDKEYDNTGDDADGEEI
ncbi:MAG: hypothetical protein KAS13_07260 [Candidatus Omnitrophica bacterium]|nr:hypothetical protein [Candidatus Omnitrophota bacterium]